MFAGLAGCGFGPGQPTGQVDRGSAAPVSIAQISPNKGPTAGGTGVTITGSGFDNGTTVTFAGSNATQVIVNSDGTSLTAVSPAHSAGAVDVQVTNSGGQTDSSANGFTYVTTPFISRVTPSSGATTGGITATISGGNFAVGASVTFGGVDATSVVVSNGSTITVTVPAHTPGPVDVTVTNPNTETATLSSAFTYTDVLQVTNVTPASGTSAGGTVVTVIGANFVAGATVTFGVTSAQSVTFNNSGSLTVVTPAQGVGTVDVTVTNPGGPSATLASAYTFTDNITITSVLPISGSTQGGTLVTINGQDFQPGVTVGFGGVAATSVFFSSSTQLLATAPAHVAGVVNVSATNPDGQTAILFNGFTYAPVSISSVFPGAGPDTGGTTVLIGGANFVQGTTVSFGGTLSTNVSVTNSTEIQAVTPAHADGTVGVTVTSPAGDSATLPNSFTYQPPLLLFNPLSPDNGPTGTTVTLSGQSFTNTPGPTQVFFGGAQATNVVVSGCLGNLCSTIQCTAPANPVGLVPVTVLNNDGQTFTLNNAFTYTAPPPSTPTVTAVSPASGPTSGLTPVTIFGTNFTAPATVEFGTGKFATNVVVVDAGTITAKTPATALAGPVDVIVTTTSGSGTGPGAYSYNPILSLSSITPASGPTDGGTPVLVNGANFQSGMQILFAGVPATNVSLITSSQAAAVTPPSAVGAVAVNVTAINPDTSTATLPFGFTYTVTRGVGTAPTISGISPTEGPTTGGTNVLINGSNFQTGATVLFGTSAATNVVVVSGQITATTSPSAAGVVDVTVTNPDGQLGTATGAFTYVGLSISDVNPKTANVNGGPDLIITGTLFDINTQVFIGGIQVAKTLNGSTQMTVTAPPHAAGPVDVTVKDPINNKTATLSGVLVYSPPPTNSGLTRDVGSTVGGTKLIINGTGFQSDATVTFGGLPATVTFLSDTQLQVVTPAHPVGFVDVVVTSGGGTSTLPSAFDYEPAPTQFYFNSGFENGLFAPFVTGFNGGGLPPVISTEVAHTGSRAAKCDIVGTTGTSAFDYRWNHTGEPKNPALSTANGLYQRFYMYFATPAITTMMDPTCTICQYKVLLNRTSLGASLGGWFMSGYGRNFGSNPLNQWRNLQDRGLDPPAAFPTNVNLVPNTWYEFEIWYKRDPATSTGVAKMWINGKLVTFTPPGPNWGTNDATVAQFATYCGTYAQISATLGGEVLVYFDDAAAADGFIEPVP